MSPHVRSPSMSRIAYVNGHYLPHADATVHVEDRGYPFADGVYEVVLVYDGALVDEIPHLDRLDRSLSALKIPQPMTRPALRSILRELLSHHRIRPRLTYNQVA